MAADQTLTRVIASHWQKAAIAALAVWPAMAFSQQSMLEPASLQARELAYLWWVMFYGACVIFALVMALLLAGLWRARSKPDGARLSQRASRNLVLASGVIIPLAVLIALVGGSLMLGRSIAADPPDAAVTIKVTGWMWWWEVEYLDERGEVQATLANEIHVPVGQPVRFLLTSGDVIHSFWVPQLQGKTDMMPGTINHSWFTATEAGIYRGQCAEFCGTQHALMAFLVVAEPQEEFGQWLEQQAGPARPPATPELERGQEVFLTSGCSNCHTVRGTVANGEGGPDLTHIGSRRTLAAGTRPNTPGHLGGWIADPQSIKPGSFMPATLMESEELTALIAYLESLE